jgi:hypothetical protein
MYLVHKSPPWATCFQNSPCSFFHHHLVLPGSIQSSLPHVTFCCQSSMTFRKAANVMNTFTSYWLLWVTHIIISSHHRLWVPMLYHATHTDWKAQCPLLQGHVLLDCTSTTVHFLKCEKVHNCQVLFFFHLNCKYFVLYDSDLEKTDIHTQVIFWSVGSSLLLYVLSGNAGGIVCFLSCYTVTLGDIICLLIFTLYVPSLQHQCINYKS